MTRASVTAPAAAQGSVAGRPNNGWPRITYSIIRSRRGSQAAALWIMGKTVLIRKKPLSCQLTAATVAPIRPWPSPRARASMVSPAIQSWITAYQPYDDSSGRT